MEFTCAACQRSDRPQSLKRPLLCAECSRAQDSAGRLVIARPAAEPPAEPPPAPQPRRRPRGLPPRSRPGPPPADIEPLSPEDKALLSEIRKETDAMYSYATRGGTPAPSEARAAAAQSERRPGESLVAAINRLEDERQTLYRDRPRGWQGRLEVLNAALSGLWEQSRTERALARAGGQVRLDHSL
jgi:hypothetical protein